MSNTDTSPITISTTVSLPVAKVWDYFSDPKHIVNWNNASDDWHTPSSENDLRVGGKFVNTMAAKDGSASFNFEGFYTEVENHKLIAYKLGDERKVRLEFSEEDGATKMVETFDPEQTHSREMQQGGWQAILDNFKKYAEENG
jgi:uncharacterized protein YndB with AHSA1/START domain